MENDFGENMNESILLGDRNELIREYQTGFLKIQAHQGLGGIIAVQLMIEYRLGIDQHTGILQIMVAVDVVEFTQNIGIPVEIVLIFRYGVVNGIYFH